MHVNILRNVCIQPLHYAVQYPMKTITSIFTAMKTSNLALGADNKMHESVTRETHVKV